MKKDNLKSQRCYKLIPKGLKRIEKGIVENGFFEKALSNQALLEILSHLYKKNPAEREFVKYNELNQALYANRTQAQQIAIAAELNKFRQKENKYFIEEKDDKNLPQFRLTPYGEACVDKLIREKNYLFQRALNIPR